MNGPAEVCDLEGAFVVHQQVFGFDVAVDYVLGVQVQ